ncbi:MAG: methyltransferase domain-containing protein [Nitrospinales bacterium]
MTSELTGGYGRQDWQKHYDTGDLRWDLGEVSPPFARLWREKKLRPGKTIVPGCGRGHEVVFFAERGFDVTGVDFSPGAVTCLTDALSQKGLRANVLLADFFELDSAHDSCYDLVLEQTFFCAIAPSARALYVETVHRLLQANGLLVALFYETNEEGGPPYHTGYADIPRLFSRHFAIEHLEKTPHSIERRRGREWLGILRKR